MKNLVSRCRIRFLWWLLRWQHLSNSAAAVAEETVACDVVFSVFWRVFGLPQVARKFGEQFFFPRNCCQIKTSYENFQNARRKYPQRPFLGHRPLFGATFWPPRSFQLGRFTTVVWWRPIAADGSAGPYVGKLRAIVAITQPFPWFRGQVWSTFEEVGKRHATQGTLW